MAEKKLGRGLDFLIKKPTTRPDRSVGDPTVPVEAITPNPFQPRTVFKIEGLNDLISSIEEHGVLQPIAVRRVAPGRYELISGERRWRACRELGLESIPAVVRDVGDQKMLELALIENIQREDLDPIEKANAYRRLIDDFKLTQEEVAKRVSQKRSTVANYLRLLDLPPHIREQVAGGSISMGHARALLAFSEDDARDRVARAVASGTYTVRAVEKLARTAASAPETAGSEAATVAAGGTDPHVVEIVNRLRHRLATKVALQGSIDRGRLTIEFYSRGDLDRILEAIDPS